MTRYAVTAKRTCGGCGGSFPPALLAQNRCPRCLAKDPKRTRRELTGAWSEGRDPAVQARFRRRLMERSGGQCEAILGDNGPALGLPLTPWWDEPYFVRCPNTEDLDAHHTDPGEGLMLCNTCHRKVAPHARRRPNRRA